MLMTWQGPETASYPGSPGFITSSKDPTSSPPLSAPETAVVTEAMPQLQLPWRIQGRRKSAAPNLVPRRKPTATPTSVRIVPQAWQYLGQMKIFKIPEITYGEKNSRLAGCTDVSKGCSGVSQIKNRPVHMPRLLRVSCILGTAAFPYHFRT